MALIIRFEGLRPYRDHVIARFRDSGLIREIVQERIGERTLLAKSSVPGLWVYFGVGVLRTARESGPEVHLGISGVNWFAQPVPGVTAGDGVSDSRELPYNLDIASDDEFNRVLSAAGATLYVQQEVHAGSFSEALSEIRPRPLWRSAPAEAGAPAGFHSIGEANRWQCQVLGYGVRSPDGATIDAIALDLAAPHGNEPPVEPSQALFVSSSIASLYVQRQIAIGDEYEILYRPDLCKEALMAIRIANPAMRLYLPQSAEFYPDLNAARVHRRACRL